MNCKTCSVLRTGFYDPIFEIPHPPAESENPRRAGSVESTRLSWRQPWFAAGSGHFHGAQERPCGAERAAAQKRGGAESPAHPHSSCLDDENWAQDERTEGGLQRRCHHDAIWLSTDALSSPEGPSWSQEAGWRYRIKGTRRHLPFPQTRRRGMLRAIWTIGFTQKNDLKPVLLLIMNSGFKVTPSAVIG